MGLSALRVLGIIGLFLCAYALYVEYKVSTVDNYVASCDIPNPYIAISCSKVFSSKYAYDGGFPIGLEIPNAAYGSVVYALILVLDSMKAYQLIVYLSSLTFLSTLYLGYILAFVLKDLCLVCVSTYIVNACIFFAARYYASSPSKMKRV